MKKYLCSWSEAKKTIEVKIFENDTLVETIDMPNHSSETYFLESSFPDGNFVTSNKFSNLSDRFVMEDNQRIYRHYKIVEDFDRYTIVGGKRWDDGFWRSFTQNEDNTIEIKLCLDGSTTIYNCETFEEVAKEKDLVIKKKVLSPQKKLS